MDSLPQVGQFVGSLLFGSLTGLQCDHPEWGLVGTLATTTLSLLRPGLHSSQDASGIVAGRRLAGGVSPARGAWVLLGGAVGEHRRGRAER